MNFKTIWQNRTARILIVAAAALLLLLVCWFVFGHSDAAAVSEDNGMTEQERRLSAILSSVDGAGEIRAYITKDGDVPVSVIVFFSGDDGILVRLRLTQIAARALDIAENRVLVCPSEA